MAAARPPGGESGLGSGGAFCLLGLDAFFAVVRVFRHAFGTA
jgi:hypothetical protein